MHYAGLILEVFALVFFVIAAFVNVQPRRVHFGWLGLACFIGSILVNFHG
jgi:hypothetical protein